jgi:hypothetical protein
MQTRSSYTFSKSNLAKVVKVEHEHSTRARTKEEAGERERRMCKGRELITKKCTFLSVLWIEQGQEKMSNSTLAL